MKLKKTIKHFSELHVNYSNVFKSFFKGSNAYETWTAEAIQSEVFQ